MEEHLKLAEHPKEGAEEALTKIPRTDLVFVPMEDMVQEVVEEGTVGDNMALELGMAQVEGMAWVGDMVPVDIDKGVTTAGLMVQV